MARKNTSHRLWLRWLRIGLFVDPAIERGELVRLQSDIQ